jgi:hypothetical protein
MNLAGEQLKDTYGNLLTIGTTAGSPTTGTIENGDGQDITSLTIAGTSDATLKIDSNRSDIILAEGDTTNNNSLIRQQSSLLRFDTIANDLTTITRRITLNHGSGDISFRDGSNNEAFYWDASTARLGLGTTSPNGRLNIKSSASGQYLLNLDYADNTDGGGFYESSSTDLTLFLKDSSGNTDVQIASNGNSYFNGGNVGIGTTSPSAGLHVNDTTYPTLRLSTATSYSNIYHDGTTGSIAYSADDGGAIASSSHQFYIDGAPAMKLNGTGLGIGTTSPNAPNAKFTVKQSADTSKYHGVSIEANGTDEYLGIGYDGTSFTLSPSYLSAGAFKPLQFHTSNNPRLTIDTSGNVGIGTTSPSVALEVAGSVRIDNGAGFTAYEVYRDNILYGSIGGGSNQFTLQASNSKSINLFDDSGVGLTVLDGGNVGIGTSSPSDRLEVKGATAKGALVLSSGDTTIIGNDVIGQINFKDYDADAHAGGDQNDLVNIKAIALHESGGATALDGSTGEGYALSFSTSKRPSPNALFTVSEAMRIDSSGNAILNTDTSNTSKSIRIGSIDGTSGWSIGNGIIANSHQFLIYDNTAGSSRLLIDSSGNVLVGKTTSSIASEGVELFPNDRSAFTRDSGYPILVNRLTSDGDLINFRKDGTTVGSIGTFGSDLFIGTNDSGLRFEFAGTNAIVPFDVNSVAVSDNATDLGANTARFKDLYLSGSVYLGGTTSSNALDDYEEGTHQATVTCTTSGTITLDSGMDLLSYTKIGRLMTVTGQLQVSSVSSPTGRFSVSLPTSIADLSERAGRSSGSIFVSNTSTNADNFFINGIEGQNSFTVYKGGSTNGTDDSADTFDGDEFITLSFTYVSA